MPTTERTIANLQSLVDALPEAKHERFRRIFHVTTDAAELVFPKAMLPFVQAQFGSAEAVARQTLVKVTNLITMEGAIYNPLRASKPHDAIGGSQPAEIAAAGPDDPFCRPLEQTPENTFGRVRGTTCLTAANLVPFDRFHSVVIFDHHHPLEFTEAMVSDAIDTALAWARLAHSEDADARYFFLFWNCLWRAGSSRVHGHMQATLGNGMHHAVVEALRRAALLYRLGHGVNYFQDICAVHESLGLAVGAGGVTAFASLTPRKEKEVWVVSEKLDEGFKRAAYQALHAYVHEMGVQSFNMALLWKPIDSTSEDWSGFPAIVRMVDRGCLDSPLSDIGAMEFYGSSVVSSDPFQVADALRRSIQK